MLPDGRLASACTWDGDIRLWNLRTGLNEMILSGHTAGVNTLIVLGESLASGSENKTIRIWDTTTGETTLILECHTESINSLTVVSDQTLVSGSSDHTIRVWNLRTDQANIIQTDDPFRLAALPQSHLASAGLNITIWE